LPTNVICIVYVRTFVASQRTKASANSKMETTTTTTNAPALFEKIKKYMFRESAAKIELISFSVSKSKLLMCNITDEIQKKESALYDYFTLMRDTVKEMSVKLQMLHN